MTKSTETSPPSTSTDLGPAFSELPEGVRQRVLGWVSDALHLVEPEQLPAPLRRIAFFAPRARRHASAAPVAQALAQEGFRVRASEAVGKRQPGLRRAAAASDPSEPAGPAHDAVQVAAAAWLWRPEGWSKRVADASAASGAHDGTVLPAGGPPPPGEEQAPGAALRIELQDARRRLREERDRQRERVARMREEQTGLRARVAAERARADAAEERMLAAQADHGRELAAERATAAEARAQARRLRARVEQLEALLSDDDRMRRDDRNLATARLRLLLDTVVEGAHGLRRELGLPAGAGATTVGPRPADTVDSRTPGADVPAPRAHTGAGDRQLEDLLALPQAHLVIDGYNVTKTAWPSLSLADQRLRLLRDLGPLAARHALEVTVVFDGADLARPPAVPTPRGVRVRFSPADRSADDVVRALVRAEPPGRVVVVVSTDREVAQAVVRSGAHSVPSAALIALISRT